MYYYRMDIKEYKTPLNVREAQQRYRKKHRQRVLQIQKESMIKYYSNDEIYQKHKDKMRAYHHKRKAERLLKEKDTSE